MLLNQIKKAMKQQCGEETDLYSKKLIAKDVNYTLIDKLEKEKNVLAKIRYLR